MNSAAAAHVRDLFCEAVSLPMPQRTAFLRDACEGEPGLRAEVEALLSFHSEPHALLRDPPAIWPDSADPLQPGARLGPYQLLHRLGEGGMGVVFEAVQDRPRRIVALKILRRELMSQCWLDRLGYEAEILGRLGHPGIAHVYAAGTLETEAGPQPYIAMERITGEPLTMHAQRMCMGTRARLALFQKVCEAVQHAHSRGVIHRDLSPSNILVTADGEPKVLDFGIASCDDVAAPDNSSTVPSGIFVGTTLYMSPEQTWGDLGDLDGRVDVYALGAILYELLCGFPPHDLRGKPLSEAISVIRNDEPVLLGRRNRALRGDLEMIVATALAKQKERRYGTPADLRSEIGRFLEHRPIVARRQSSAYRAVRFVCRHRAGVSVLTCILILLIAGILAASSQAARARAEAEAARATLGAFRRAVAGPDWIAWHGIDAASSRRLLDIQQELRECIHGQPALQAQAHATLGRAFLHVYNLSEAEANLRSAIAIWPSASKPNREALEVRRDLGYTLLLQGRYEKAIEVFDTVLAGSEAAPSESVTLWCLVGKGAALRCQGRQDAALNYLSRADALARRIADPTDAAEFVIRMETALVIETLGRADEAERLLLINDRVLRARGAAGQSFLCENSLRLGSILLRKGENKRAALLFDETRELQRQRSGPGSVWTMVALRYAAGQIWLDGDPARAEPLFREAVNIGGEILPREDANLLSAQNSLAVCLRDLGRLEESESLLRQVLAGRSKLHGPDHPEVADARVNLAVVMLRGGRCQEAVQIASDAHQARQAQPNCHEATLLESKAVLGHARAAAGSVDEGITLLREVISRRQMGTLAQDWRTDAAITSAVKVLDDLGRFEESRRMLEDDYAHLLRTTCPDSSATERARRRLDLWTAGRQQPCSKHGSSCE